VWRRRPSTGRFFLDRNGNDAWDTSTGGDTRIAPFGLATDRAVTGRW
jgi:hypothetical protein